MKIGKLTRNVYAGQEGVWRPRSVKIVLPLPNRKLLPNRRPSNPFALAKIVKKVRQDAGIGALAAKRQAELNTPYDSATVQAVIFRKVNRPPIDGDNALAWLKSTFDGLQDAGIVRNDRDLTYLPVHFEQSDDPRVEITVTNNAA